MRKRGSSPSCSVCCTRLLSRREATPVNTSSGGSLPELQTAAAASRLEAPAKEESHSRNCCYLRQVLAFAKLWEIGDGQGRHGELVFSRQMQGGAAGDQHVQAGTGSEHIGQGGRGSHHLLEVVQQQQQVALTQRHLQLLEQGTIKSFPQSERLGNGRDDSLRLAHGSQRHKADTVGEVGPQSCCGSQGQARFAHASWTGEGQQADLWTLQEGRDRLPLLLASDQRGG